MPPSPPQQGRSATNDPTGEEQTRERVYCHACSAEWYRDDGGLICPACESDITEIITLDNDPRDMDMESDSPSPPFQYHDDSDPDEEDIDDHLAQHGFLHRDDTRAGEDANHHNPGMEPVLGRFLAMIEDFGGALQRPTPTSDPNSNATRITRTTFTSGAGNGGRASVTIFSTSGAPPPVPEGTRPPTVPEGTRPPVGATPSFEELFSSIINSIDPQGDARPQHDPSQPRPLTRSLADILNLFNPGNAVFGDAVYTQEALDRIITNLMEAQPQSNGAPPATEQGLAALKRRTVDEELLQNENRTECSVCIEEMKVGDTATFLPCKHWFHDECVVMWLKEHNTCPVCRAPIEETQPNAPNSGATASSNATASGEAGATEGQPNVQRPIIRFGLFSPGVRQPGTDTPAPGEPAIGVSTGYSPRPPPNTAQPTPPATTERWRSTASSFSYDTSRLQRRNSHSPTSPRAMAPAEQAARMRERSPSASNRPSSPNDDAPQQSGGPFGWIRDRWNGSGSGR